VTIKYEQVRLNAVNTNALENLCGINCLIITPLPHRVEALSDHARLTSVCLSRTLGPELRRERPRKTEIGTEVAHVTRDSDTTFNFKGQRSRSPDRCTQPNE